MPEQTHAEMMEFLPHALLRAMRDYSELLEAERTPSPLPKDDNGNPVPPDEPDATKRNKDFATHQAALKSAIINIELIYKLLEKVAAKSGGNDTVKMFQQIYNDSQQEVDDDKDTHPIEDD